VATRVKMLTSANTSDSEAESKQHELQNSLDFNSGARDEEKEEEDGDDESAAAGYVDHIAHHLLIASTMLMSSVFYHVPCRVSDRVALPCVRPYAMPCVLPCGSTMCPTMWLYHVSDHMLCHVSDHMLCHVSDHVASPRL
jgi:hypothetical protein